MKIKVCHLTKTKMKILITGGAGYLGNVIIRELLKKEYIKEINVIDNFFFNQENSILDFFSEKKINFIKGDVRNKSLLKVHLKRNDLIIPLAAIVGAPLSKVYKNLTKQLNYQQIKNICDMKSPKQIILLPVTNSGYGIGKKNKFYDETSPLNPISLYGLTKVQAEQYLLDFDNFISLRLATVFGVSSRMRIDLLVNNFVYKANKYNKLVLFESHFKRNFIHIKDVANAMIFLIENYNKAKNNIYNVGLENANLTKKQLALRIKRKIKKLKIIENNFKKDPDQRNYIVSNKKIYSLGWKPQYSVDHGISELLEYFKFFKRQNNNKNI